MFSDEELLDALREVEEKFGDTKATTINDAEEFPAASTYSGRFGGMENAREKAGVEKRNNGPYSDEELLEDLKKVYKTHGNTKAETLNRTEDSATAKVYKDRFGSLSNARRKAGIDTGHIRFSKDELKEADNLLDGRDRERFKGLLAGDMSVDSGGTGFLQMTNKRFIEWFSDNYPEHVSSVSKDEEKYLAVLRRTPFIKSLRSWYESGSKEWNVEKFTDEFVRMLYVCDGGLHYNNGYPAACIYNSKQSDKSEEIVSMFKDWGIEPTVQTRNRDGRIEATYYFGTDKVEEFLNKIAPAPKGYEYKWELYSYERYKLLKDRYS